MRTIAILIFLVLNTIHSFCQTSKTDTIRKNFPVTELSRLIIESIISRNDSDSALSPEVRQQFIDSGSAYFAERLVSLYDSMFTQEQVNTLGKFFSSDEMKNLLGILTPLMSRIYGDGQKWYETELLRYIDKLYPPNEAHDKAFAYEEVELSRDNEYKHKKERKAAESFTSNSSGYKIFYNDNIWQLHDASGINPTSDIGFRMKEHEVYAVVLSEDNDMSLKDLRYSAVYNLFKAAESYEVLKTSLRQVNRQEIMSMLFRAVLNSTEISYHNYYFSGGSRVIQFSTFCKTEDYSRYKDEMERLLNGLVISVQGRK